MGETRIGLHGRKYRVLSNGEQNATPSPPFVIASSKPWLAADRNKMGKEGSAVNLGSTEGDGNSQYPGYEHSNDQRMCETAMSPEIAIVNAKSKPDHIKIGNH